MTTTGSTHTTEPAPSGWVEKQYARTLENLATDQDGLLYDRHVRGHLELTHAGDDIVGQEAVAALRAASHGFRTTVNRWLESHGLSEGRLALLWQLYGTECPSQSDLATSMDVSPRNVTGLVDHLEQDGLVERYPDPTDRRATLVRLTEEGNRRLEAVRNDKGLARVTLMAGFSEEELRMLRHLCLKLVRNFAQKAAPAKEMEKR